MTENLLLKFRIKALEPRKRIARAWKDEATGKVCSVEESTGYWLTLDPGGISLSVGPTPPTGEKWRVGAEVLMTLVVK